MNAEASRRKAQSIFELIVTWPRTVIFLSLLLMAVAISFLPQLSKDTRADAFLASDNEALVYRNKVKDLFGLSDPLVIAVVNKGVDGIFTPETLNLIQSLTEEVSSLPNIDSSRVLSLATENNIISTEDGMDVAPFFDVTPVSSAQALAVRDAVHNFPLYLGSMVSKDGVVSMIVAEMEDEALAEESYKRIIHLVENRPKVSGVEVHVAGEGAISGYLGSYIDSDAQRLNPITGLVITLIIILAYRRLSPALLCGVIIAASVLITLGIMAANNIAFFIITNALPVILIGISVADAIHVYSHYFDIQSRSPKEDKQILIVETMVAMWRPITLTTLTTMAGFLALYFAAYMPPFKYFGLFAAVGVFLAWLYSLVFLPAAMMLSKPEVSQYYRESAQKGSSDGYSRVMICVGQWTMGHSIKIILFFGLLAIAGIYSAVQLQVDEDRIDIFHSSEAVYKADKVINKHMDGTNALDIVIETSNDEDLFRPDFLRKIEALQSYAATLPHVQGSTSIADYIKQINRALNGGEKDNYIIPDSKDLIAQYFLIYSAMSDPTDFEEEIDYEYKTANIRVNMNSGGYQDIKRVIEALQLYLDESFNTSEIKATLSGRVNLNYHWIKDLSRSHFVGLFYALIVVWAVSACLFRSMVAGIYALIPVGGAILFIYAAMVSFGMTLGVGTSMFAAVSIGLGTDFAIHTLDRLRTLYQSCRGDLDKTFKEFYPSTGRALLFNFLAIACGFGVLISSKIVSLNNFGGIVVMSVTTSFIASMTLLPALIKVFRPSFITGDKGGVLTAKGNVIGGLLLAGLMFTVFQPSLVVADSLSADEIVERVNSVEDGEFITRKLSMKMVDRRGKERSRETVSYRKYYDADMKTVLFYLAPANVRNTAFLIWDYSNVEKTDDQWLYLPALRKVRRISASDRGDYFLGTDFTYEDIKLDGKLEPSDSTFALAGEEFLDGVETFKLTSSPRTEDIASELGYGRTEFWVDKSNWMVLKVIFWDVKDNLLKTMSVSDIRQVGGIWTRHNVSIENHKTGHQTHFTFSDVDYQTLVKDGWFTKRALSKGHK